MGMKARKKRDWKWCVWEGDDYISKFPGISKPKDEYGEGIWTQGDGCPEYWNKDTFGTLKMPKNIPFKLRMRFDVIK
jgi:hypothetical protein